jgi:hypothetical protein
MDIIELSKYKIVKLSEKTILNKKDTKLKIYKKNKRRMTLNDIKKFYKYIKDNDENSKFEVLIQARHSKNNTKMTNIKGFNENDIVDKDEDYYNDDNGDINTKSYYINIYLREKVKRKNVRKII